MKTSNIQIVVLEHLDKCITVYGPNEYCQNALTDVSSLNIGISTYACRIEDFEVQEGFIYISVRYIYEDEFGALTGILHPIQDIKKINIIYMEEE